jgi:hypothetical protein
MSMASHAWWGALLRRRDVRFGSDGYLNAGHEPGIFAWMDRDVT